MVWGVNLAPPLVPLISESDLHVYYLPCETMVAYATLWSVSFLGLQRWQLNPRSFTCWASTLRLVYSRVSLLVFIWGSLLIK